MSKGSSKDATDERRAPGLLLLPSSRERIKQMVAAWEMRQMPGNRERGRIIAHNYNAIYLRDYVKVGESLKEGVAKRLCIYYSFIFEHEPILTEARGSLQMLSPHSFLKGPRLQVMKHF